MIERREPAQDMGWCEFRIRLLAVLRSLRPDDFLILESADNGRFVQVAIDAVELRIESVSDHYLLPAVDQPLTAEHHAHLVALGYEPPSHGPDDDGRCDHGSPNHWMDVPAVNALGHVTGVLVDTLRLVHDVPVPARLRYDCFNRETGRLALPDLAIPRIR